MIGESAAGQFSASEFLTAVHGADVAALAVTRHFDHETVISLAERFRDRSHFFLLESAASGPGSIARYSFLGFDPLWLFAAADSEVRCGFAASWEEAPRQHAVTEVLHAFDQAFSRLKFAGLGRNEGALRELSLAQLCGAIGYFSYDVAAGLEPSIGAPPPAKLALPRTFFYIPCCLLVVDQLRRSLTVIVTVAKPQGQAEWQDGDFARARAHLVTIEQALDQAAPVATLRTKADPLPWDQATPSFPESAFYPAVERCLEHIRAGDIFQIQIGNRLTIPCAAEPFSVFRHLRVLNPSPYMFYYRMGEHHVLGASPEMMVQVQGQTVTHRPIAGTRKRTWNEETDRRMRHELATSEKERAEHVMLIDLARNDVGRIAAPGTVRVDELMVVEEYSHVFHLVSQVSGQLAEGQRAIDALVAGFPNGTVSGAPKIKAMQLINELEPCAREFYAGCLGMFDFCGNLKSTILIRTIHMAHGMASTQASAGIVYDSVPKHEWQETRNKMAACMTAMTQTL